METTIPTETLVTSDPNTVRYYKANPHLNFVIMNQIFTNILQNLSSNLSDTLTSTINTKILSVVSDIEHKLDSFKTGFNDKLHETKREYIEDIKVILTNHGLTNNEKMTAIVEKNTDNILTKTSMIINDIIPRTHEKTYAQIESCIRNSCLSIERDTQKLLESKDSSTSQAKDIVTNIENIFSKMITTIQQPIFTFIQSSEERTTNGLQQLKQESSMNNLVQDKLTHELTEFLNKYKNNSSTKGNVSETELYHMLQYLMQQDEVLNVSSDTASCDFRVNRKDKDKPTILFENKDYSRNVTTEEVRKFERDIQLQNSNRTVESQLTHGIFISQKTPITFKDNFQIDIINGCIHLYLTNLHYDTDKLKTAIEIVDNLASKLLIIQHNKDDGFAITQEDVNELADEYRLFGMQKMAMQETIKTNNKLLLDKLEDIQLPRIKKLLVKFGNVENDNDFKCMFCNVWSGKNKASLAAHIRNCKSNHQKNKPTTLDVEVLGPQQATNLDSVVLSSSSVSSSTSSSSSSPLGSSLQPKQKKIKITHSKQTNP
jgi:hypothetical protein